MQKPIIYIDTTVLKFSATELLRLRPQTQIFERDGKTYKSTVNIPIILNPNDSIKNLELKAEAELLKKVADIGKLGYVDFVINTETLFESWGLPKMDSESGKFYKAPLKTVDAPIKCSRVMIGLNKNPKVMQLMFLCSIKEKRFIELQKMTGGYQGKGKWNQNQLLDAFHLWCAEYNKCDYFLTLDFKLIRVLRNNKTHPYIELVKPSELLNKLQIYLDNL